ncbi:MAG: hypothetical protein ACE5GA_07440 [Candidatus Zixiibacteriota bacterium]
MSANWPELTGPDYCETRGMGEKATHKLKVYVASEELPSAVGAPELARKARGRRTAGLISFAIPDHSIIFRCRVICPARALTATAAVTALRFLETTLEKVEVERVEILTDSASFYFDASGQSGARGEAARSKILKEYREKYELSFQLVERINNAARRNAADVSRAPTDITPALEFDPKNWSALGRVLPPQDGVEM